MIQPGNTRPAPSPKKILAAYPAVLKVLEEAKSDGPGHLTRPRILKTVERVISAL